MPIYCYKCPSCGEPTELLEPHMNPPVAPKCACGGTLKRSFAAESPIVETEFVEPIRSVSAGIHPNQVPAMLKRYPHHRYDRHNGDMLFTSKSHQNRCMRDLGWINRG